MSFVGQAALAISGGQSPPYLAETATMSITTILFDAGGTLVYLDYTFLARELRRAGVSVSSRAIRQAEYAAKAEIDRRMRGPVTGTDDTRRRPYFSALLDGLAVDSHTADQVIKRLDAAHKEDNLWRLMMPSTPRVLQELRAQGFTLGVVSNSDGRIADILHECGILTFFGVVIDSHEVGVEKPDPHIFHLALAQIKKRPEQTAYVGDIYGIDVVGAERAGLRPLLLDTLGYYNDVPCTTIRHLRELLAIL